jgi:hypothetical protein
MKNSHPTSIAAKLSRAAIHAMPCALGALVVLATQLRAQCPKAESETEYEKVTLTDTSKAGPGLTTFDGRLYLAWTGTDGRLNVARASDGLHFEDKVTLSERSRELAAPPLTAFDGKLYLAWTGVDQHLNVMSSSDGRSFDSKVTLGERSLVGGPALAVYGGKLYLAWTGTDRHVNVISSSDGKNFQDKVRLDDTAIDAPAIAGFEGRLFLAWAQSLGGDLNVSTGIDFTNEVILPERSYWFLLNPVLGEIFRTGPALATFNDKLYLAWSGTDKRLNLIPSLDGTDFPSDRKITLEEGSERAPASAEFNERLYLAWRGNDSHLNVLRLTDLH